MSHETEGERERVLPYQLSAEDSAHHYMRLLADALGTPDFDIEIVHNTLDALIEDAEGYASFKAEAEAYRFQIEQAVDRGDEPPPVPPGLWMAWRDACADAGSGVPSGKAAVARPPFSVEIPAPVPGSAPTLPPPDDDSHGERVSFGPVTFFPRTGEAFIGLTYKGRLSHERGEALVKVIRAGVEGLLISSLGKQGDAVRKCLSRLREDQDWAEVIQNAEIRGGKYFIG